MHDAVMDYNSGTGEYSTEDYNHNYNYDNDNETYPNLGATTLVDNVGEWEECYDDEGNLYWYNAVTGESQWPINNDEDRSGDNYVTTQTETQSQLNENDSHSLEDHHHEQHHEQHHHPYLENNNDNGGGYCDHDSSGIHHSAWTACLDEDGNTYYFNNYTQHSQWEIPEELIMLERGVQMYIIYMLSFLSLMVLLYCFSLILLSFLLIILLYLGEAKHYQNEEHHSPYYDDNSGAIDREGAMKSEGQDSKLESLNSVTINAIVKLILDGIKVRFECSLPYPCRSIHIL